MANIKTQELELIKQAKRLRRRVAELEREAIETGVLN